MGELEQMVLIENLVWLAGLVAPVISGVVTISIARQPKADRMRVCLVGTVAAFALGTVGSYVAGETILGAMGNTGDLPWHGFFQAWHQMWYPPGIGVLVGIALTIYALYPKRPTA